jgi:hypothetical protein
MVRSLITTVLTLTLVGPAAAQTGSIKISDSFITTTDVKVGGGTLVY